MRHRSDTARSSDPLVGRLFLGKYLIARLVGEGGMGRVYLATQVALEKRVCLKVLRREIAQDAETQARFQREARAASRLNHPNGIQVLDFGKGDDGELYLAMEYIEGRDLQQIALECGPMPEPRVCHLMAQALDALSEAHAQKVIHRDLKPENIMVTTVRGDPDFVKVLDFGIATIQDGQKITQAGVVFGTPEYLSPEQARGEPLDARSDLYSAGVILYQLVTGKLPFKSETPIGFVLKHANEPPIPPRQALATLSPAMERLIERSLSKNRDDRPPSASAMRTELLAIASSGNLATVSLPAAKPRRPRARMLAAGSFAALAAAGLVAYEALPAIRRTPIAAAAPAAMPETPKPVDPAAAARLEAEADVRFQAQQL
ncbi:MAG: serine/threonine-protein kinase, partial [Deltaproteobacteria bacterium]